MFPILIRLLREERAQDLVEYALLTATVGLAGIATWPLVVTAIGQTYGSLDNQTQYIAWPPDPAGGGS
jgi:Flp pilus assembly pilin Flp